MPLPSLSLEIPSVEVSHNSVHRAGDGVGLSSSNNRKKNGSDTFYLSPCPSCRLKVNGETCHSSAAYHYSSSLPSSPRAFSQQHSYSAPQSPLMSNNSNTIANSFVLEQNSSGGDYLVCSQQSNYSTQSSFLLNGRHTYQCNSNRSSNSSSHQTSNHQHHHYHLRSSSYSKKALQNSPFAGSASRTCSLLHTQHSCTPSLKKQTSQLCRTPLENKPIKDFPTPFLLSESSNSQFITTATVNNNNNINYCSAHNISSVPLSTQQILLMDTLDLPEHEVSNFLLHDGIAHFSAPMTDGHSRQKSTLSPHQRSSSFSCTTPAPSSFHTNTSGLADHPAGTGKPRHRHEDHFHQSHHLASEGATSPVPPQSIVRGENFGVGELRESLEGINRETLREYGGKINKQVALSQTEAKQNSPEFHEPAKRRLGPEITAVTEMKEEPVSGSNANATPRTTTVTTAVVSSSSSSSFFLSEASSDNRPCTVQTKVGPIPIPPAHPLSKNLKTPISSMQPKLVLGASPQGEDSHCCVGLSSDISNSTSLFATTRSLPSEMISGSAVISSNTAGKSCPFPLNVAPITSYAVSVPKPKETMDSDTANDHQGETKHVSSVNSTMPEPVNSHAGTTSILLDKTPPAQLPCLQRRASEKILHASASVTSSSFTTQGLQLTSRRESIGTAASPLSSPGLGGGPASPNISGGTPMDSRVDSPNFCAPPSWITRMKDVTVTDLTDFQLSNTLLLKPVSFVVDSNTEKHECSGKETRPKIEVSIRNPSKDKCSTRDQDEVGNATSLSSGHVLLKREESNVMLDKEEADQNEKNEHRGEGNILGNSSPFTPELVGIVELPINIGIVDDTGSLPLFASCLSPPSATGAINSRACRGSEEISHNCRIRTNAPIGVKDRDTMMVHSPHQASESSTAQSVTVVFTCDHEEEENSALSQGEKNVEEGLTMHQYTNTLTLKTCDSYPVNNSDTTQALLIPSAVDCVDDMEGAGNTANSPSTTLPPGSNHHRNRNTNVKCASPLALSGLGTIRSGSNRRSTLPAPNITVVPPDFSCTPALSGKMMKTTSHLGRASLPNSASDGTTVYSPSSLLHKPEANQPPSSTIVGTHAMGYPPPLCRDTPLTMISNSASSSGDSANGNKRIITSIVERESLGNAGPSSRLEFCPPEPPALSSQPSSFLLSASGSGAYVCGESRNGNLLLQDAQFSFPHFHDNGQSTINSSNVFSNAGDVDGAAPASPFLLDVLARNPLTVSGFEDTPIVLRNDGFASMQPSDVFTPPVSIPCPASTEKKKKSSKGGVFNSEVGEGITHAANEPDIFSEMHSPLDHVRNWAMFVDSTGTHRESSLLFAIAGARSGAISSMATTEDDERQGRCASPHYGVESTVCSFSTIDSRATDAVTRFSSPLQRRYPKINQNNNNNNDNNNNGNLAQPSANLAPSRSNRKNHSPSSGCSNSVLEGVASTATLPYSPDYI